MHRVLLICAMASAVLGGAMSPRTNISVHRARTMQLAEPNDDVKPTASAEKTPIYSETDDGVKTTAITEKNPIYSEPEQRNSPLTASNYYIASYPDYPGDPYYGASSKGGTHLVRLHPVVESSTESPGLLSSLAPIVNYAVSYGTRITSYLGNFVLVLLVGGALTAAICMFTPLCTIFLGLCLNKHEVKEKVTELARTYITPESINVATLIVKKAIDKYVELQREQEEAEETESNMKTRAKRRRR